MPREDDITDIPPIIMKEYSEIHLSIDIVHVNRIPVMVPLSAPIFGVIFLGGISPSKIGPIAPS
jgi:hypothetical protein